MSLGAKSSAMCPRHQALIVRITYAIEPSASTEILSFSHRYSRVWLTAARKCALTPQSTADGPRAAAPRKGLVGGPPLISDVRCPTLEPPRRFRLWYCRTSSYGGIRCGALCQLGMGSVCGYRGGWGRFGLLDRAALIRGRYVCGTQ